MTTKDPGSLDVVHRAAEANDVESLEYLIHGGGWAELRELLNRPWNEAELTVMKIDRPAPGTKREDELTMKELARHWKCWHYLKSKQDHVHAILAKVQASGGQPALDLPEKAGHVYRCSATRVANPV